MSQQANGANLLISRGRWYFNRFDANGNPTSFRFVGEAEKGDLTPSATTKERYTKARASNNKIADVTTQQKHVLSIELMEFTRDNIALALFGDGAVLTQSMATITAETIAGGPGQGAPAKGGIYATVKGNITALTSLSAVPTGGGSSTALVAGTDYALEDGPTGLIQLLSTTAAAAGSITATYTVGMITGSRITASTSANIIGAWRFIGDPTAGPKMNVNVWRSKVSPSAALSLLGDDFTSMTLSCEVLDDSTNHPDSPLYDVILPNS